MTQTTAGWAGRLVRRLRDAHGPTAGRPSDGELVGQFVADRDGEAFAELVRRHGPMVLGVCRRVLGHRQDAEDAFQAVFFVLARRAAAVRSPDGLGNWLYGVAYRTALGARRQAARRRAKEREAAVDPRDTPAPDDPWADLRPAFDAALATLPDKYRQPIVLCDLEGRPRSEVARRLGLPEGTISSRLARARAMLRTRLARRGLALPPAALAAILSPGYLQSAVPAGLAAAAVGTSLGTAPAAPAVLALAHEVLRAMILLQGKWLAVAAAVFMAGGGVGIYAHGPAKVAKRPPLAAAERPAVAAGQPPAADPAPDPLAPTPATPEPTGAGGTIVAVDPAGRTVTVARKPQVREVVPLTADTRVLVDGQAADLPDIPTGTVAAFVLSPDDGRPRTVAEMRVTGPAVTGRVVAVSDTAITLDLGGKWVKPPPREYRLDPAAASRTAKDGRVIPLDVRVGETATVHLTADQSTVVAVSVARGDPSEKGKPRPADRD
jgi:RNA polymerase sigma factor (sigma-70 family)